MKQLFAFGICAGLCAGLLPGAAVMAQDVDLETGDTAGPDAPVIVEYGKGWFTHGYFRFGAGSTDGDPMSVFRLDGALSKYRLGNESDLYGEDSLGYRLPLDNGRDIVAEVMLNGWANSNALIYSDQDWNDGGGIAQAYVGLEASDADPAAGSFLWAGRRYYRRKDVHITDFYYENFTGDGIGLENLQLGFAATSNAIFYHDDSDIDYQSTTLDMRLHDIALGKGWLGAVGVAYLDGTGEDAAGSGGYSIRFYLDNLDLGWAETRNALQYGVGAGIDFTSVGNASAGWEDNRLRLLNQTLFLTSDTFQTQATAVWQRDRIGGEAETWVSLGLRPQYNFTDNWGAALEIGYDWFEPEGGDSRSLSKITLAPFYSFGKTGFFARPQLRAYVTWADWSDPGAITEQAAFGSATSGTSYGLQLENWW